MNGHIKCHIFDSLHSLWPVLFELLQNENVAQVPVCFGIEGLKVISDNCSSMLWVANNIIYQSSLLLTFNVSGHLNYHLTGKTKNVLNRSGNNNNNNNNIKKKKKKKGTMRKASNSLYLKEQSATLEKSMTEIKGKQRNIWT